MKKILLIGAMTMAVLAVKAQDYKPVLQKTFETFVTATEQDAKVEQSNKLSLIAKKWDGEWATHYYAALSKTMLSYTEKNADKRDAYLDEAEKERDAAVSLLKKENDETYVLAAMIANARMVIDGANRWQKYGKIFSENLENAKEINPDNPRMYYLQGTNKYYTPKAYGGGKKAAMPYFEKAQALFAKEKDDDITKPSWGKRITEYYLGECKKED
jgi:hypothetical protein